MPRQLHLFMLALAACSSHDRLSVEPCMHITDAVTRSTGLELDDFDSHALGEWGVPKRRWSSIEFIVDDRVILTVRDIDAVVRGYEGRITEVFTTPTPPAELTELSATVRVPVTALLTHGFEVFRGDPESFASAESPKRLRMIRLRRGDYEVHLSLELGRASQTFRLVYGARSVGACRSPAYNEWLSRHEHLHDDKY